MIELSSQAFVPQRCFRLVPFGVQIVARAVGSPGFPLLASLFAPNRATESTTRCKNDTQGDRRSEYKDSSPIAGRNRSDRFRSASDEIAETLIFQARNAIAMGTGDKRCGQASRARPS